MNRFRLPTPLALFLVLLFAALIVASPSANPTHADDGYEPDEQVVADIQAYARETRHGHDHVLRWMRVLITLGVVEGMSAAEAQGYADRGWQRWAPAVAELEELEAQDGYLPDGQLIVDVQGYARETRHGHDHMLRWMRVLHTFGALDDMTAAEAQGYADRGWTRWDPVAAELAAMEGSVSDPDAESEPQANRAPVVNNETQNYKWFVDEQNARAASSSARASTKSSPTPMATN